MKVFYTLILCLIFTSCAKQYGTPFYVSTDSVLLNNSEGNLMLDSLLSFDKTKSVQSVDILHDVVTKSIAKPSTQEQEKNYIINTSVINQITIIVDSSLKSSVSVDTLTYKRNIPFPSNSSVNDSVFFNKSSLVDTSIQQKTGSTADSSYSYQYQVDKTPDLQDKLLNKNEDSLALEAAIPLNPTSKLGKDTIQEVKSTVDISKTRFVPFPNKSKDDTLVSKPKIKELKAVETKANSVNLIESRNIFQNNSLLKDKKVIKSFTFYFELGSVEPENHTLIFDSIQTVIHENKEVIFLLAGFTDKSGSPSENLILSNKRADKIRAFLVLKGVSTKDIYSQFFGDEYATADKSKLDRKVECIIMEKPIE